MPRSSILSRSAALAGTLALLSSCGGGLEQASFGPECAPDDLACLAGGIDAPLALGAVLPVDLDLQLVGSGAPELRFVAADPDVLKISGNELTGQAPGMSALLVTTAEGQVLDFTHVWVAAPTRVGLHRSLDGGDGGEVVGPVELLVGDEISLALAPYADGLRLRGQIEGDWAASGEAVTVLATGAVGQRRVVAREVGSAEISVFTGERELVLTVEVLP